MADLKTLIALVRPKCPGPVDFLTEDALAKVYREFCLESKYLQQVSELVDVEKGKPVKLTPPANHYLLEVITAQKVNGSGAKHDLVPGDVDYSQPEPGQLVFNASHTKVVVTFSYCPTALFDRSNCSDDIVNRWASELACGAVAELRMMPGNSWTDAGLADYYRRDFVQGYRDAKRARQEQFDDFQNYTRKRTFF